MTVVVVRMSAFEAREPRFEHHLRQRFFRFKTFLPNNAFHFVRMNGMMADSRLWNFLLLSTVRLKRVRWMASVRVRSILWRISSLVPVQTVHTKSKNRSPRSSGLVCDTLMQSCKSKKLK